MVKLQGLQINDHQRLNKINLYPIPYNFIISFVELSWFDIKWGYDHGIVNAEVPVKNAERIVLKGKYTTLELELSFRTQNEPDEISQILSDLCDEYKNTADSITNRKWLFVTLSWLWSNLDEYEDPLGEVENIYAAFNYPENIDDFIRYMPPSDGYDPSKHTQLENTSRLLDNWRRYLEIESAVFK
ncbi:DUF2247 family protein [Rahnella bonaserana]